MFDVSCELDDGRMSGRKFKGLSGDDPRRLRTHYGTHVGPVPDQLADDLRHFHRGDRTRNPHEDAAALQESRRPSADHVTRMHDPTPPAGRPAAPDILRPNRGAAAAPRLKVLPALDPSMSGEPPEPPTGELRPRPPAETPAERLELPVVSSTSQYAEVGHTVGRPAGQVAPVRVERGVVVFDLDGTILDDLALIAVVAADVLFKAFATPPDEGRVHYLATTGMPFEAQLSQLYPEAPADLRASTARTFHQRKVVEAYAKAKPFPEIPKLLKRLGAERWTLAVSTGAETEMADLLLEREGLRYWFEEVLGSADGTKREHLAEYRRRYPEVPMFLVGDSRFDMEAAQSVPGVTPVGRASTIPGWGLTPLDLQQWGAKWAEYTLSDLPEALARLERPRPAKPGPRSHRRAKKP